MRRRGRGADADRRGAAVRNQLYGERSELTDLGLACRAGEEAPKYCGEVAGTYGYMAPEVLRGGTVSPLSDLYSLGALAYRLLGGPPERRSAAAAKLSAGVADVIDCALEPDPDARQSSVAEFRAQLLAAHVSPGLVQKEGSVNHAALRDHTVRVTTDHPVSAKTAGMATSTSTGPLTVARLARALTYLVYAFVVVAMVLLLLGFFLLLFGANPDAPFAEWVYPSVTRVMAPFRGLFEAVPLDGRSVVDVSVLFAMIVYALAALVLQALIEWLTDRIGEMGYAG